SAALVDYWKAVPDKANDPRLLELRDALEKGDVPPPLLTAEQRLAIGVVEIQVRNLLEAQKNQQPQVVKQLADSISTRFDELLRDGAEYDLGLWRTIGIFALATEDIGRAAWAGEALLRLAGNDWENDPQLVEMLP